MSLWRTVLPKGWRLLAALSLILGVLLPVWGTSGAAAQDNGSILDIAEAAPDSSVIFWTFDLNRDSAQWKQAQDLLARVGFPNALDMWEQQTLSEGSKKNQITQEQLDALLGGEVAVAVTPDAIKLAMVHHAMHRMNTMGDATPEASPVALSPEQPLGVSLILAPSDPDASWTYVQTQFANLAKKNDAQVEELTHGNSDVLWVALPDMGHHKMGQDDNAGYGDDMDHMGHMDEWGDVEPAGVAAAHAGDYIVAGASQADVEQIIDVVNGDQGSLADSATMQQIVDKLPDQALSFTYVDGVGILNAIGPDADKTLQSLAPGMSTEIWRSQVGMAISAADVGFRVDSIAMAGEGGSLESVAVDNDPTVAEAAGKAPAGTLFFEAGDLAEGTLSTAPYAIAMAMGSAQHAGGNEPSQMPTEEEIQQQLEAVNQMVGFDIKSDFFDLLSGGFLAFSGMPMFSNNGVQLDSLVAISSTDPDKLTETTDKIAALIKKAAPQLTITDRDVNGDTVHALKLSSGGEVPDIEFGVVNGQLVVGTGKGVATLSEAPSQSLADDAQFQEVMSALPDAYYQVVYLDVAQLAVPLMAMVGSMETSSATPTAMSGADLQNIKAFAAVGYRDGDAVGSSAILYIAKP